MMKRALAAAALLTLTLTACDNSSKPKASQCGVVVGNGAFDARSVKRVAHPGEKVHKDKDDEDFFFPCGVRNYIITNSADSKYGDSHEPVLATLGAAEGNPGVPVKVYLRIDWTLNQNRADNDAILKRFFEFCFKYHCASNSADDAAAANFSTPGWNGMLRETTDPAIRRAVQRAAGAVPEDTWAVASNWHILAEKASALFTEEYLKTTGGGTFYCSALKDPSQTCEAPPFSIDLITPVDEQIVALRDQQARTRQDAANKAAETAQREAQLAAERTYQEKQAELYKLPGYVADRDHARRLEEIAACKAAGATCVISISGGAAGAPAVVVPVKP